MEKQYLVITKYEHSTDSINECSADNLYIFLKKDRPVHIFEYDFEKIKAALTEVDLKIVPKQNEEI